MAYESALSSLQTLDTHHLHGPRQVTFELPPHRGLEYGSFAVMARSLGFLHGSCCIFH